MKKDELRTIDDRVKAFDEVLDDITGLEAKIKSLLHEIYENSINDRDSAAQLFEALKSHCLASKSVDAAHAMHSKALTGYLERMHRSNDQLIRIVSIISEIKSGEEKIDNEGLLDQFTSTMSNKGKK